MTDYLFILAFLMSTQLIEPNESATILTWGKAGNVTKPSATPSEQASQDIQNQIQEIVHEMQIIKARTEDIQQHIRKFTNDSISRMALETQFKNDTFRKLQQNANDIQKIKDNAEKLLEKDFQAQEVLAEIYHVHSAMIEKQRLDLTRQESTFNQIQQNANETQKLKKLVEKLLEQDKFHNEYQHKSQELLAEIPDMKSAMEKQQLQDQSKQEDFLQQIQQIASEMQTIKTTTQELQHQMHKIVDEKGSSTKENTVTKQNSVQDEVPCNECNDETKAKLQVAYKIYQMMNSETEAVSKERFKRLWNLFPIKIRLGIERGLHSGAES